ncbi:MAG: hypothetical protein ACXABO_11510 [Promethearchaeota archaeon]|jgi:hypothetical protein
MSGNSGFRRNPAIHCWIKHIEESNYNEDEKMFYTIFGKVKRIRILATIIEKDERLIEISQDNFGLEEDKNENVRIGFILDDSTGLIRAIRDGVNHENLDDFSKGDIVDVVGTISTRVETVTLWIEIMNKVEEPNQILLRDAEIIARIKSGDIQKITTASDKRKERGEMSKEIDVNELFEEKTNIDGGGDIKEKVFSVIKSHSTTGAGVSFEKLRMEIKIPDIELRTYVNDLILESLIFESDEDRYESF